MIELTTRIAVCTLGRPPITASAMKQGKRTSPNRGMESNGQRVLGALSGIARLTAQNSPYGAPNRRHATTVSATLTHRARLAGDDVARFAATAEPFLPGIGRVLDEPIVARR